MSKRMRVMRIREIMSANVVTIDSRAAAENAWSRMQADRIRHLVVTEDSNLIGIISQRDLGGRSGAQTRRGRMVRDLMTLPVVSVGPQTTLRAAANLMRGHLIGSLAVLEGDRLVGIVTATDVLDELGRGSARPTRRPEHRTLRMSQSRREGAKRPVVRRSAAPAKTGRGRARQPDSRKRTPLPDQVAKASKRQGGRTDASLVPAHIRVMGVDIGEDDRAYVRRKLGMKLGKFASSIERVSIRLEDLNGPRGGIDKVCRIKVVLSALPSVIYEQRDATIETAIDGALAGTERAVRRSVQRRRMKPAKHLRGAELLPAA
jgi:CBS domain-containing protein/ribosome-associated translation inhibitor RaiA